MLRKSIPVVVWMAFVLSACAHLQPTDSGDPIQGLKQSVTAHWQAKQDKKWEMAYTHFCKAENSEFSLADYLRSANIEILGFEIESVEISRDNASADVTVRFEALIQGFKANGMKLKEKWLRKGETWCLTPPGEFKELFEK